MIKANRHFKNSIHNLKTGIITRGVLIDIPRLKGVPYLEQGTPIYVEDLEAWEKQAGVSVGPGDALFVRTGRVGAAQGGGPVRAGAERPGRRPRPFGDSVVEAAGHRLDGQRSSPVRVAVECHRRRA